MTKEMTFDVLNNIPLHLFTLNTQCCEGAVKKVDESIN